MSNCLNTLDVNNIQVDFYGPATDKKSHFINKIVIISTFLQRLFSVDVYARSYRIMMLFYFTFWSGESCIHNYYYRVVFS